MKQTYQPSLFGGQLLVSIFELHLRNSVKSSSWASVKLNCGICRRPGILVGCAFIHAVMPGAHKTTVSDSIKRMADDMGYRADIARETRMRDAGAFDPGL